MASPVDTSVKIFYSTMSGAPQGFQGVIGSALPVILACLVTGFDEVTLTSLTVSSGVATATFPSTHSAVPHSIVLIDGAGGAGFGVLNGEQKVVTRVGNTVTFATTAPDGTATGPITMKMAPAGWTQEYTGTNLLALRPGDVSGNRHYLRLQDTATTTLRALGYESMSAISTGVGQFPTTAQLSGGCYWPKSDAANSTPNPWMIVADGKRMYLGVATGYSTSPTYTAMNLVMFGDFTPYKKTADSFSTLLSLGGSAALGWDGTLGYGAVTGVGWSPRPYTGVGTSVSMNALNSLGMSGVSGQTSSFGNYPGLADGLYLSKTLVAHDLATSGPRGSLPGLWLTPQYLSAGTFVMGDLVTGGGETAGRTLAAMLVANSSTGAAGAVMFDVTGPW